jgi:K+-sensing histidine kinase KdpD
MATSVNLQKSQEPMEDRLQDRERLRSLAQLAESVSHAVQNPLTSIFLHADILEEELGRLQAEHRQQALDSLGQIRDDIARVRDLVEQYLILIRLPTLPRQAEDLGVVLESLVLERRQRLADCGIDLRLRRNQDLGQIAVHVKAFERALLNVLEHAVETMPHGGSITLHVQRTAAGIRLDIHQTGEGMSSERLSQSLGAVQGRKPGQIELGLCLTKEVMVAHGGTFEVTSHPDMGITLTATLPPLAS